MLLLAFDGSDVKNSQAFCVIESEFYT